jgi:hypothetical protein
MSAVDAVVIATVGAECDRSGKHAIDISIIITTVCSRG